MVLKKLIVCKPNSKIIITIIIEATLKTMFLDIGLITLIRIKKPQSIHNISNVIIILVIPLDSITPSLENNDARNHLLNINPKIIINQPEDNLFILAICNDN